MKTTNNSKGNTMNTNTEPMVFRVNTNGVTKPATDETDARFEARKSGGYVECSDGLGKWFRCSW